MGLIPTTLCAPPWLCRGLPGSTSTVGSTPQPAVLPEPCLRGPEPGSAWGRRDKRDAPCRRWQEPYGAGATGPAVGTGSLREAGGTGHLPALVATEGHRKAWKLEAQSSLTVPMARRPRVGQGEPGGHRAARRQLPAAGTPGCPRRPRSVWSRGRRLWQREAPAAGAHAPAAANPRSLPAQGPAGAHGQRPAAQSHLEDTELGKFVAAAPWAWAACPLPAPDPHGGCRRGIFRAVLSLRIRALSIQSRWLRSNLPCIKGRCIKRHNRLQRGVGSGVLPGPWPRGAGCCLLPAQPRGAEPSRSVLGL